jgi:hypothetical protein
MFLTLRIRAEENDGALARAALVIKRLVNFKFAYLDKEEEVL